MCLARDSDRDLVGQGVARLAVDAYLRWKTGRVCLQGLGSLEVHRLSGWGPEGRKAQAGQSAHCFRSVEVSSQVLEVGPGGRGVHRLLDRHHELADREGVGARIEVIAPGRRRGHECREAECLGEIGCELGFADRSGERRGERLDVRCRRGCLQCAVASGGRGADGSRACAGGKKSAARGPTTVELRVRRRRVGRRAALCPMDRGSSLIRNRSSRPVRSGKSHRPDPCASDPHGRTLRAAPCGRR